MDKEFVWMETAGWMPGGDGPEGEPLWRATALSVVVVVVPERLACRLGPVEALVIFVLRPEAAADEEELKLLPEVTTLLTLSARLDLRRGRTTAGE